MLQQNMISEQELEQIVSDFMLELGIPAHLRGYQFLRSAVEMCVGNMKIERAIRNAIEVSWERGNSELFEELFGYCNSIEYSRPTNSEYIAATADYIRLKYDLI